MGCGCQSTQSLMRRAFEYLGMCASPERMASQNMLDFSDYIVDRTHDFTGREWVFDEIDAWLADPQSPSFFIITGEPGVGKSAIAARLTQVRKLAAYHFCIARQIDTIDSLTFVRSLSLQLADHCQPFAQALTQVGHAQINVIKVSQTVAQVASGGEVKGVVIQNLILGNMGAQEAFVQTVLTPLKAVAGDLDQPLVILVDSLDEAVQRQENVTIVHLLASAGGLTGKVRFVLTSRPEGAALRHFKERQVPRLLLDASRAENQADILAYILGQLDSSDTLQARLKEQKMSREVFVERITTACKGNFLYLIWLLPAIANGTQRFDRLEALPAGLDGIYREFLRTRTIGDIRIWRDYRPLLGVLSVAQAPLTSKQLCRFSRTKPQVVSDFIVDAEQFLDPLLAQEGRYQLYHQSLVDFFNDQDRAGEFWVDSYAWHSQIIESIRGIAQSWGDIDWSIADEYSIRYLTNHIYSISSATETSTTLFELINQKYMRAKYQKTGSHSGFASDVDRAIQIAKQEKSLDLLQFIHACVLFPTLASLSANVRPKVLATLAQLDNQGLEAALGIIQLIQDPTQKSEALITIAVHLPNDTLKNKQLTILNEALKASEHILDMKIRVELLTRIAQAFIEIGEKKEGKFLLDQVLAITEQIEDLKTKTDVQVRIARLMWGLGEFDKALAAAEVIKVAEEKAEVLLNLAKALMVSRKPKESQNVIERALEVTESITDPRNKLMMLIQSGDLLMQLGREDLAQNILDRASRLVEKVENGIFDDRDWQLRLEVARTGKYDQAQRLIDEAISFEEVYFHIGEAPSVWIELAHRLVLATDRKQVGYFIEQALTEAMKYHSSIGYIWTLIDISKICMQAGKIESTLSVLDLIQSKIMEIVEREDQKVEYLIELAQLTEKSGADEHYQRLLIQIIETAERADDIRIINTAAQFLARAGKDEQSRGLLAQIPETIENIDILCEIAQLLNRLGEREKAQKLITQILIREEFNELQDFKQEEAAIKSHILASAGDIDPSLEMAEQIKDSCLKAQTLCRIIQSSFQSGALEKALAVYNQVIQMAEGLIKNPKGKPILSRLVQIMAQSGQHVKALEAASWVEYADEMAQIRDSRESGLKSNQHGFDMSLANVTNSQCLTFLMVHQPTVEHLAVQQSLHPQDIYFPLTQVTYSEIILSYHLLETALDTAERIEGALIKAKALLDVAEAFSRARMYEQEHGIILTASDAANASIERAVSAAEQIKEPRFRVLALYALMQVLALAGKHEQFEMIKNQIEDARTQAFVRNEMAQESLRGASSDWNRKYLPQASLAAERTEQIVRITEQIKNPEDKVQFFCNAAQLLAEANRKDDARLLLVQALDLARLISREAVLQVLFAAIGWIHVLESFEFAWRIHESVVEIDGWWVLE